MFYVTYDQIVGLCLRKLRKEKGLSQESISNNIGCANSQYCRYETGDTPVSISTLRDICLVHERPLREATSIIHSLEELLRTKGVSIGIRESFSKLEGKSLRAVAGVP